jgi:hypothetical protein
MLQIEVHMAVKMLSVVCWVVTLFDLVDGYQYFSRTYCLFLDPEGEGEGKGGMFL